MGVPISLFVIAAGAILAFAVTGQSSDVNIQAVGWILMVTGAVGLLLSIIMWDSWAGGRHWTSRHEQAERRPRPPV
jgi:uncharacterized membrane protein